MPIGRIIISIAVFIGILLFQRTKPKLLQVILIGFILSFIFSFFDGNFSFSFSALSFGILVLSYFIYCLCYKKWLPALITIFALISFIFQTQHWPYGSEIEVAMLIPIILFLIALFNFKKHENQISILTIIVAYEISVFIKLIDFIIAFNS